MRILVINDDANVPGVLAAMLRTAGYEVVEASSCKEGIGLYRQTPFDLIVTDLLIPIKEGLEVVMELRRDSPEVKIITLSGEDNYSHSSLNTSMALGAVRTVRKPFKEDQLLAAVREVLVFGNR